MNQISFQAEIENYFPFLVNNVEKEIFNKDKYYEVLIYPFQLFKLAFYRDYDIFQIQFILVDNKISIDAIILINYIESTKIFDYNIIDVILKINFLWKKIPFFFTKSEIEHTIKGAEKLKKIYQKQKGI